MSFSVSLAKRYLSLMPVEPPTFYRQPKPLERAMLEYSDEASGKGFLCNFSIDLRERDVLDLGCGYGGRTVFYAEQGAKSVTGLEIEQAMIDEANAFAASRNVDISVRVGVAEQMPFADNSFDAIFSYDVFEHVSDLAASLRECLRVLRPSGTLYAIFPPVHNPTGGSHLHGYVSKSPAPNVLFSPETLMRAIDLILRERGTDYRPRMRPGDYLPSVNGATTASFQKMLRGIPFRSKRITFQPIRSRKAWPLNPAFRLGSKIPVLREVCTLRIVAELTK